MDRTMLIMLIIAAIVALFGSIALFVAVLPERRRPYLSPALRVIADILNMRTLMLEKIFKGIYVFLNLFCILGGIVLMFTLPGGFPVGIVTVLLGPVVLRILHEMLMIRLMTLKTLQEIRRAQTGGGETLPEQPAADEPKARQPRSRAGRQHSSSGRRSAPEGSAPASAQSMPRQAQSGAYPAQSAGYPAQGSPYPVQTPGYPIQNPGYPSQNPAYPAQNVPWPGGVREAPGTAADYREQSRDEWTVRQ